MNKKLLPIVITLSVIILLLPSLNTAEACDDDVDDEDIYDCENWSTDDHMVNLGVSNWSLLDGTAKVTAYNLSTNYCPDCHCCVCAEDSELCACCDDCGIESSCIKPILKPGILTHRGTRGLGVLGGTNDDEIDNEANSFCVKPKICSINRFEGIVVEFDEAQEPVSFEVGSLFIESYQGELVVEECDILLALGNTIVKRYHVVAEEQIGTSHGIVQIPAFDGGCVESMPFDKVMFFVMPRGGYAAYSDFAVAKIVTTSSVINFIQPIEGIDCGNPDENHAPVANDDEAFVDEDSKNNNILVLENDEDEDPKDTLSIDSIDVKPEHGTAVINKGNGITYTPDENYFGWDSFVYNISDDHGAFDTATVNVKVKCINDAPVAIIDAINVALVGQEIKFDGSSSYDVDGCIIHYNWSFYNVESPETVVDMGTGAIISYSWDEVGVYNVTLKVVDYYGAEDEEVLTVTIYVELIPPVAVITGPNSGFVGEEVSFSGVDSYDLDGYLVNYTWDLGDGNISYSACPDHIYDSEGDYIVTLTVKDNDDLTDTNTTTIVITVHITEPSVDPPTNNYRSYYNPDPVPPVNKAPIADVSADEPYSGLVDEEVTFNGSLSSDDKKIVLYNWDFGDGNNATGVIVDHVYDYAGVYIVNLTVSDEEGKTNTDTTEVVIIQPNRAPSDPVIEVDVRLDESEDGVFKGFVGVFYQFNFTSFDADNENIYYMIDWGDGSTNHTELLASGDKAVICHKYSDVGDYIINVTAFDENDENSDTTSMKLTMIKEDKPKTKTNFASIWLLLIAILIGTLLLLVILARKKRKKSSEEEPKID